MRCGKDKQVRSSIAIIRRRGAPGTPSATRPKVKVPTLILCGADDEVDRGGSTPVGTARRLAELVPGCELALVPNVKHMTFWDGGGALAALQDFLSRHPIQE